MDECLGLFAKHWQPGHVKTRLAQSIGDDRAAKVARALLAASITRFSNIAPRQVVAYSPDDDETRDAFSGPTFAGWRCTPQVAGDLGQRMKAFFQRELSAGARSVVLLGSDTPNLPVARVRAAFESLRTHDVALGPTEDGGYYLIGLAKALPAVFEAMPWSKPDLWQATVERLTELGASFQPLQPWYDIDEIADLERLLDELKRESGGDSALDGLRRHLLEVLESL